MGTARAMSVDPKIDEICAGVMPDPALNKET